MAHHGFVIGNPPFMGKLYLLDNLGDGYLKALRSVYEGNVPDGADFVMYWWQKASALVRESKIKQFGFITTNSINQAMNRRVVRAALDASPSPSLIFAIPDHPWVDSEDGADVRIAMTVLAPGDRPGTLAVLDSERFSDGDTVRCTFREKWGKIQDNLQIGAAVTSVTPLRSNSLLASTGLIPGSRGFILTSDEAAQLQSQIASATDIIFPFRNGRDITETSRNVFVVDTHGWSEEALRSRYPAVYQRLHDRVYPERMANRDPRLRRDWWLFRRSNDQVRESIANLQRYIVTSETSRHRTFVFLDSPTKPEHKLIVIGSSDAYILGVVSSRPHVVWALAAGGHLGIGNDPVYSKTTCFDPYPFPVADDVQKARIRSIAEALDVHRKGQQAKHPGLKLTDMYSVLKKLRSGEQLSEPEVSTHEKGLVSVLKQLHDNLDAAVLDAYGWPQDLSDDEILRRLVDLNRERAAEEARGVIRWLRPEYQNPEGSKATTQGALPIGTEAEPPPEAAAPAKKQPWPKALAEQAQAVRAALSAQPGGMTAEQLARTFQRGQAKRVAELLDTLVSLGQARELTDGRYVRA